MPRTRHLSWMYQCDALGCGVAPYKDRDGSWIGSPADLEVHRGDACNTARGTEVHDQADADAHARTLGWQITSQGETFCPACTGRAA